MTEREIPVKKKWIASKGLYGYPRTHSGNSRKKVKKLGATHGATHKYNPREHALYLQANMKLKMVHHNEARRVLKD